MVDFCELPPELIRAIAEDLESVDVNHFRATHKRIRDTVAAKRHVAPAACRELIERKELPPCQLSIDRLMLHEDTWVDVIDELLAMTKQMLACNKTQRTVLYDRTIWNHVAEFARKYAIVPPDSTMAQALQEFGDFQPYENMRAFGYKKRVYVDETQKGMDMFVVVVEKPRRHLSDKAVAFQNLIAETFGSLNDFYELIYEGYRMGPYLSKHPVLCYLMSIDYAIRVNHEPEFRHNEDFMETYEPHVAAFHTLHDSEITVKTDTRTEDPRILTMIQEMLEDYKSIMDEDWESMKEFVEQRVHAMMYLKIDEELVKQQMKHKEALKTLLMSHYDKLVTREDLQDENENMLDEEVNIAVLKEVLADIIDTHLDNLNALFPDIVKIMGQKNEDYKLPKFDIHAYAFTPEFRP